MTDEEKPSDEVEVTMKSSTRGALDEAAESGASEGSSSEGSAAESKTSEGGVVAGTAGASGPTDAKQAEEPNIAAAAAHGSGGHGHDGGHGHGGNAHEDHDEHLGHTAPVSLLVGVLIALGMLTVLTVAVTAVDLGSQGNFVVAMIIATVKAILVMGYFMHMFWDAKFNVVAFTSSFLFVLLFLAMAVLDGSEYQQDVKDYQNDKKAQM